MGVPYIQVAGKSELLIGFSNDDYATLHRLGEQTDMTQLSFEQVLHDVPGDSQGGPQGDPIEQQVLALRIRGQFNLSKWDPQVRDQIIKHNIMTNFGSFADNEIGQLLLRDRSFRVVIRPSLENLVPANDLFGDPDPFADADYFFYNFPCCTVSTPIETGQGTKWSALQFGFRAWRVPEGHLLAPSDHTEGLIWNKDDTGVAEALGLV